MPPLASVYRNPQGVLVAAKLPVHLSLYASSVPPLLHVCRRFSPLTRACRRRLRLSFPHRVVTSSPCSLATVGEGVPAASPPSFPHLCRRGHTGGASTSHSHVGINKGVLVLPTLILAYDGRRGFGSSDATFCLLIAMAKGAPAALPPFICVSQLTSVCQHCCHLSSRIHEKSLTLDIHLQPASPTYIHSPQVKLRLKTPPSPPSKIQFSPSLSLDPTPLLHFTPMVSLRPAELALSP